jgi:Zn-dependent protease
MFDMDFEPIQIVAMVAALAVAIIGHEIMHGFVAYKYGDMTAKYEGRLSVNPIVHIDPIGTIVVPLLLFVAGSPFLFGWAKPVPVNIWTVIRNGGYNGAIAVALAGIAYNLILAVSASFLLPIAPEGSFASQLLFYLVLYNVVLAVFNTWPIPPLDGSNALGFVGKKFGISAIDEFNQKVGRYGMIILIIILATPLSAIFMFPAKVILAFLL